MWGFVWPQKSCLSVSLHNLVGYNEDVVFAWGVVGNVSHLIGNKVLNAIYL